MSTKPYILALLAFLQLTAWGQQELSFPMIIFENEFEEHLFQEIEEGNEPAHFDLLLAAGGVTDSAVAHEYYRRLESVLKELDREKLIKKRPKKIVKTVFNTVHEQLLTQYVAENQFREVFESGRYNCVSATILYSYALAYLDIPHYAVETPDHVYAVALVDDETWVIESTDPQQGFYEVDEDTREEGLDNLQAQKMITEEQRRSPKIDSILAAMFPEEVITKSRLISLQYSNLAHYELLAENNPAALQAAAKAYAISPHEEHEVLLISIAADWMENTSSDHEIYMGVLGFLLQHIPEGEDELIEESFKEYCGMFYNDQISETRLDSIYQLYDITFQSDSTLTRPISALHGLVKAEKLLKSRYARDAYPYALRSLKLRPHADAQQIMMLVISQMSEFKTLSTESILDTMDMIAVSVPEIRDHELWNPIYIQLQSDVAWKQIMANDFRSAKQHLMAIEAVASHKDVQRINPYNLERVYGRVLMNYYKIDRRRARETLARGLELMPNSEILKYYEKKLAL